MGDTNLSPLRSDALRNRERLVDAARDLFARQGIDVALETVATEAGVSIGTLYNRFPTRERLLEAVFIDRLERTATLAETALLHDDPWMGFVDYLSGVCELQATDRGFNDIAGRGFPPSPAVEKLHLNHRALLAQLLESAKAHGPLREDVAVEDLAFVVWGISRTIELTADTAPEVWRRHLSFMIDGFRAEAAHPLLEPPFPPFRRSS